MNDELEYRLKQFLEKPYLYEANGFLYAARYRYAADWRALMTWFPIEGGLQFAARIKLRNLGCVINGKTIYEV